MKSIIFAIALLASSSPVNAQQYNTALGVKLDWSNLKAAMGEISVKHFFNSPHALEVNLGGGRRYIWLQTMYIYNMPLSRGRGVEWYLGAGMDGGYWNTNYDRQYDPAERSGYWFGFDANAGIEYTFDHIPINLALDAGPTLRMVPDVKLGVTTGLAVRYAFR